ncbi:hypothetical protein EBZ38_15465 [bacterium]|nr:hypothetical protein [bacterium]
MPPWTRTHIATNVQATLVEMLMVFNSIKINLAILSLLIYAEPDRLIHHTMHYAHCGGQCQYIFIGRLKIFLIGSLTVDGVVYCRLLRYDS